MSRSPRLPPVALLCLVPALAWGFAEEQTDPTTKANVSTHHLYLTRALAVCAGFEYADGVVDPVQNGGAVLPPSQAKAAEIIAFNDEMTDVGTICTAGGAPCSGNGCACDAGGAKWTNCTPNSIPQAAITGDKSKCPAGTDTTQGVFPVMQGPGGWQPALGCFSQRFSPWSPLFHFPTDGDLEINRAFAMGETQQLSAPASYGWGPSGSNLWSGSCYLQPAGPVPNVAIKPGSLEALGMYLHSLGDRDSHRACRENWTANDKPAWYFHTMGPAVKNCAFNDHVFEYGCADSQRRGHFLQGTQDGAEHVFSALLERAARDKRTPRIASLDAHGQWLRRQLQRYITLYQPSVLLGQNLGNTPNPGPVEATQQGAAKCRTQYAWALLQACVANAGAAAAACLPDVTVPAGSCPAQGQVGACPGQAKFFPVVPACTASGTKAGKKKERRPE